MATLPGAPRIPYERADIDAGMFFVATDGGTITELTQSQMEAMADESTTTAQAQVGERGWLSLLLPAFDLYGFIGMRNVATNASAPQYSLDTTDGHNGTWTTMPATATSDSVKPNYRTSLNVFSVVENVVGVRFGTTSTNATQNNYMLMHVYGYLRGASRLEIWHPTLDQRLDGDHFDLGTYTRGGSAVDVDFRVKNRSATKTANSVSLGVSVPTDTGSSPTVLSWHTLSDGGAFGAGPLALGNLAAGSISDVVTLRRQPPSGAALGYWTGQLYAAPSSWT